MGKASMFKLGNSKLSAGPASEICLYEPKVIKSQLKTFPNLGERDRSVCQIWLPCKERYLLSTFFEHSSRPNGLAKVAV